MIAVEHTVPEKILLAASELESPTFSAETLVVAAWSAFPATFGLTGYADQFPDANRVLASLMGKHGLVKRGWLDRKAARLYALTRLGRGLVQQLLTGEPTKKGAAKPKRALAPTAAKNGKPPPALDALLQYLLADNAVSLYRAGRRQELTFAAACRFWSFRPDAANKIVSARIGAVASAVADIARMTAAGEVVLDNGRVVTADDAALLSDVHEYLCDKFRRHLVVLEKRKGARR